LTAIRIVPPSDEAPFPYEAARGILERLPGVTKSETDIPAIVAAGAKLGWPQDVIDEHWEWMRRGKCFDFNVEDGVSGTLWEDNIFFRIVDFAHEEACLPLISAIARQLSCRITRQ
jgi:hypothetical protein